MGVTCSAVRLVTHVKLRNKFQNQLEKFVQGCHNCFFSLLLNIHI